MEITPPLHATVHKDGYTLTFYPGFLREASVSVDGGAPVVLYEQGAPYDLRHRLGEPLTRYALALMGGPNGRDFTLQVDDPELAVAEIVVRLRPPGGRTGDGTDPDPDEEFVFRDNTVTCPPVC